MKFRPLYLSAALALLLAGCGAKKMTADQIAINKPLVAKKAPVSDEAEKRWSHLDIINDTIPGMSVDRAYTLLKDRKATNVIVGVVDSGVDIDHPDLKSVIWTNSKEIAGNGKDDDNNGYIDDVHGWNFLGDAEHENMELVRILKKGDKNSAVYKRAKAEYDKEFGEATVEMQQIDAIAQYDRTLQSKIGKKDYTVEDLKNLKVTDPMLEQVKENFIRIFSQISREEFISEIEGAKEHFDNVLNYHLNMKFDGRKIVGDNPDDFNDRGYGNNNVIGPVKDGAKHGTHVAGIIAQVRGNGIGGDGVVANNVWIMPVRAVPDGDEYDKDVALAIRYAVDNGAKVINGSFGKYYSPHADWVYDAIKYAASKDVLIVCAAGNEAKDLDPAGSVAERYPNDDMNSSKEISDNFLCVGAISHSADENLLANFSNYGKSDVDVFAPGVRIYATTPNNNYEFLQGTSMASPNAAGVAALIRSYYPDLTASQVKHILMDSGVAINMDVALGSDEPGGPAVKKPFRNLSRTGRIVNAYNAIIMADRMSRK